MYIVVANLIVHYEILDRGTDQDWLLILHGWGQSSAPWLPLAEELSLNWRVVILDLPGFGQTNKPEKDFDTYDYANFVQNFLAKLGVRRCHILGHSFGGRVAIVLAAKSGLVKKLVLVSSAGVEHKPLFTGAKIFVAKLFKPFLADIPFHLGSTDYQRAGVLRKTFVKVVNQNLSPLLSRIKVPTLVIWGSNDKVLGASQSKIFRSLISHCSIRLIYGSGHNPHLDKPQLLVEILKEFL